jgi:hypothetical protein
LDSVAHPLSPCCSVDGLLFLHVGDDWFLGHFAHSPLHEEKLAIINAPDELSSLTDHR